MVFAAAVVGFYGGGIFGVVARSESSLAREVCAFSASCVQQLTRRGRYTRLLDVKDDKARLDVWRESFQHISSASFCGNDDNDDSAIEPDKLDY